MHIIYRYCLLDDYAYGRIYILKVLYVEMYAANVVFVKLCVQRSEFNSC